jgi:hypothetical protein
VLKVGYLKRLHRLKFILLQVRSQKIKIKREEEKGRTDMFPPPAVLSYVTSSVVCLQFLKAKCNTNSAFVPYSAFVCSYHSLSKQPLFTYKVLLIGLSNGSTMCSV